MTAADGFGMDHPIFAPDLGWYLSKEFRLLEGIAELGAEDGGEGFDGDEALTGMRKSLREGRQRPWSVRPPPVTR